MRPDSHCTPLCQFTRIISLDVSRDPTVEECPPPEQNLQIYYSRGKHRISGKFTGLPSIELAIDSILCTNRNM